LGLPSPTQRKVIKRKELSGTTIVSFGKLAEIAGEYLSKGSSVYVEGVSRPKSGKIGGNKKQITKVIGSTLIMLGEGRKKEDREPGDEGDAPF
jgi:single-stranded DNA-binding protein